MNGTEANWKGKGAHALSTVNATTQENAKLCIGARCCRVIEIRQKMLINFISLYRLTT